MEKDEKDIENIEEEKAEFSLEDELKAQDEFAFLDDVSPKASEIEEIQEEIEPELEPEIEAPIEKEVEEESLEALSEGFDEDFAEETQEVEATSVLQEQKSLTPSAVDFEDDVENNDSQGLITVRPVKFQQFEPTPPNRAIKKNLDIMQDILLHIKVELGRTKSSIREVMEMEKGTIVELDKVAGEQVEVFVNDKLVAKGEVIVIEDKFGVRVTSTNIQKTIQ